MLTETKIRSAKPLSFAYKLRDGINAPFKREIGQYYEKEALIWNRIAAAYGLPVELPPIVKKADWLALFIEAKHIVVPDEPTIPMAWVGWAEHGEQAYELSARTGIRPWCWDNKTARREFTDRFVRLSN